LAGHKGALAQSRHHHRNAIAAYGRLPKMAVEALDLDDVARCTNAAARLRKRGLGPIEITDVLDGLRGATLGRVASAVF
jgi:hypothetical protein